MEEKIAIVTDSTSDLTKEELEKYDITSIPLKVIYSDQQFHDRVDITPAEVYKSFEKEIPTTSMPSPQEIMDVYTELKKDGYTHIISIHISSGLSATYSNCMMVSDQIEGIEVEVIDSKMLSKGLGRLVLYANDLVENSELSFVEIIEKVEAKKDRIEVFFVVETLKYLKKGGRIGKVSGTIAEFLNIKPIIAIDDEGEYFTFDKVRGRKRSLKKMYSIIKDKLQNGKEYIVDIMNAAAEEEAQGLLEKFEKISQIKETYFSEISPVMVVHTGPGLIGAVLTEMD
ncbi:MAG: degV family protein [Halanaerobium sp. 4-GBenrich]|jgi:DegV family protein with EDD domain|uniref:DegV family protein with EDD domain n=1 Tax=Halanaerobium congolense TaxID=54121 RepID=A0A1G6LH16_9FIRM|nr:DegV family protein [Halanaerobium congolense]KXS48764.1 MAG: degV family protein [Halanaerobium sp. T82-1]ODS50138.1 MAG: degV family protein [Halanaerobium sp. 4-GBenrich]OEG63536.1 MAG: fatty acid-binding protein DegV [Halanaerobium sp. MDAL1]PUU91777.1 MAG: degV family protein [Halanaerobium sp.]PTX15690.1 DegV family protein with EDD domain [Halanaerobium congolense]